jgi:hypothetical protein
MQSWPQLSLKVERSRMTTSRGKKATNDKDDRKNRPQKKLVKRRSSQEATSRAQKDSSRSQTRAS